MTDHLSLFVDRLVTSSASDSSVQIVSPPVHAADLRLQSINCDSVERILSKEDCKVYTSSDGREITSAGRNGETPGPLAECRICQEEDEIGNLESPCACSGSLKFAHRKCVQHWCNEKGDTICEICRQSYESGYTAPPQPVQSDSIPIDISSANWGIAGGQQIDLHESQLFAVAAEHHFLEADYDEYAGANASSAACFRSAVLILMALLLLRHTLSMTAAGVDEDVSTFFMLFLLRAVGFLLPCYIMVRAINVLQRRRQRQEASMAAAEVAYLLQSGQARGVRIAIAPPMPTT